MREFDPMEARRQQGPSLGDATESVKDWDGPVRHDTSSGTACIGDDGRYGLFTVYLEIDAGPCSQSIDGPSSVDYKTAVDWARDRTERVLVRVANTH